MCALSVTPPIAIDPCSFLHLSFFASQLQHKESSFPLLDIPDEMLTPDQLEVKKRQRILRSAQQGRAKAQALQRERRQKVRVREMAEGQGQRDGRRSGSERRQRVRVRETAEGQGQRDDRGSRSERWQKVRVSEMAGQGQRGGRRSWLGSER